MWLAQDDKLKEFVEELVSEEQLFRIVKQMVKDTQDVSGSSCVTDENAITVTASDGVNDVWGSTWISYRTLRRWNVT